MITRMRKSLEWNAEVYEQVRRSLRVGMTELELLSVMEETYFRCAGRSVAYSYDLVSGPRSGAIEGEATNRILQEGDCVLLDIQVENDGVWCDTTRTFFLGTPSPYWADAYAATLAAIRAGEAILRAGTRACDIYSTVSSCIERHGFSALPHHAGHAIGRDKLEPPQFLLENEQVLQAGMVVTLEPGIYLPGVNGIRVENNYLITEGGFEPLFNYPEAIEHFVIAQKG